MGERVLVATHKGLFTLERRVGAAGAEWALDGPAFAGSKITMALEDHRDGWCYAATNDGHFGVKLHRSDDGGQTWEECATPVYPPQPEDSDEDPKLWSLQQIWALEPGGAAQPGLLWAGTLPGGLFRSPDRGATWELVESLWNRPERRGWFGGGADWPGIHSICVDPQDSDHVLLGVSCGGVWVTEDGGETWACRGDGLRAEYMPPERQFDPNIQDPHRVAQCAAQPQHLWMAHHNGVFHSTDGAASWQELTDVPPTAFGFAAVAHPTEPGTAWFVPAHSDACRIPVDGKVVVTRTRDGGRSFECRRDGLPQQQAFDLVYRHGMDVSADGNCLVLGSTTGSLWVSEDQGDTWQTVSNHLPPIYCVRFGR